jgi:hypothetical protein
VERAGWAAGFAPTKTTREGGFVSKETDWRTSFWVLLFSAALGGMFLWANMIPEPRKGGDALDPTLRKIQGLVRAVEQLNAAAQCMENASAMYLAGSFLAPKTDLLRYPKWLEAGQSYEACFRSCPYEKKACRDADVALYEADMWLRQNPKPSSPSRPRRRRRSR